MSGTREGGKKAAKTREERDPGSLKRAGKKGGFKSRGKKNIPENMNKERELC